MACIGKNKDETAMALTVGLPLGIATKLLHTGKINPKGVVLPIEKEIYEPILAELKTFGISFEEKEYMMG
jgi:saccharopine dehydrogenase-like NADP-dependent oxidoreductase